jgi:hypothetical protein
MDRKSKNRRRPAEGLKNFPRFLRLLININRNEALQRNCMEIATFYPIAAKQFCLLLFADGRNLGISQWLSHTL